MVYAHQDTEEQVEGYPSSCPDTKLRPVFGEFDRGKYKRDRRKDESSFLMLEYGKDKDARDGGVKTEREVRL